MEKVLILGCGIDRLTRQEALGRIGDFLSSPRGRFAVTLNSEMLVRSSRDEEFRRVINEADLVVADGMGVLGASSFSARRTGGALDIVRLLRATFDSIVRPRRVRDVLPERISGVDLMEEICASDHAHGKRLFLLGAREGVAAAAADNLALAYPHLVIAGATHGFFGDEAAATQAKLIASINEVRPDILFVALGAPRQETWIHEHLKDLPSVRFAMGVGGSFDVLAGRLRRAPRFWREHGLEWLWRFLCQPRRLPRIARATLGLSWRMFRYEDGIRKINNINDSKL